MSSSSRGVHTQTRRGVWPNGSKPEMSCMRMAGERDVPTTCRSYNMGLLRCGICQPIAVRPGEQRLREHSIGFVGQAEQYFDFYIEL